MREKSKGVVGLYVKDRTHPSQGAFIMYKPHHRNAGGSETLYNTIGIEMIIVEMDQVGLDQFNLMGDQRYYFRNDPDPLHPVRDHI